MHALGNVRASQNRLDDAFELHQNALLQYKSTIGNNHHRTADLCHKVAQHYIRLELLDQALTAINQALKVWTVDKVTYQPEIARTSFLKGKLLDKMGSHDEAVGWFRDAFDLRRRLVPGDEKRIEGLEEDDFDELVTFWSR